MSDGRRAFSGAAWMIASWPLVLAFGMMVFVSARELANKSDDTAQPIGGPGWEARFPARVDAITTALQYATLPLNRPVEEPKATGSMRWMHRTYAAHIRPDERQGLEAVIADLRSMDPGLTVSPIWVGEGVDVRIGLDGLLTHTLELRWGDVTPAPARSHQLAMIVSELGDDLRVAREVVDLEGNVGVGVRPFRPFSKEVAELARHFDREVWLDLTHAPDAEATLGESPVPSDANGYLESALVSVPYAIGVARDRAEASGSGWTEGALESAVKQRKLFYVAAARSPRANAHPQMLSVELGDQNTAADVLATLGSRAQAEGSVIGLGSATTPAAEALRHAVPEWRKTGLDVVAASKLIEQ